MAMAKEEIIKWVLACRNEAVDAFNEKRELVDRAWMRYNNREDFSNKEDWQSKLALPKYAMAIDQAVSLMKDSLSLKSQSFRYFL